MLICDTFHFVLYHGSYFWFIEKSFLIKSYLHRNVSTCLVENKITAETKIAKKKSQLHFFIATFCYFRNQKIKFGKCGKWKVDYVVNLKINYMFFTFMKLKSFSCILNENANEMMTYNGNNPCTVCSLIKYYELCIQIGINFD